MGSRECLTLEQPPAPLMHWHYHEKKAGHSNGAALVPLFTKVREGLSSRKPAAVNWQKSRAWLSWEGVSGQPDLVATLRFRSG